MRIASVILDIDTQALEGAYSYAVPDTFDDVVVGCAVLVPFGRRRAIGFVIGIDDLAQGDQLPFDLDKLKPISQVLTKPYFNERGAKCAQFLSERYLAPLSRCVKLFTPPGGVPKMKFNGKFYQVEQPSVGEVDDRWVCLVRESPYAPKRTAVKQIAILEALRQGDLRVMDLAAEYGAVSSALKSLEGHGAIRIELRRRMRGVLQPDQVEYAAVDFSAVDKPTLTPDQERACQVISQALDAGCGQVVVVDGVTGSGKTEVYLRAIEQVVAAGKAAIVLVPEISLTPQTVARFRGRFGDMVAVLHSRMSNGERYDQWDFIASGAARVVVGARSALFSPVQDLGLIVIDEEHESSYKQDSAPRYVSRDVAEWMAKYAGAALVLGSATPSIEALHQVRHNPRWSRVEMCTRANGKHLPEVEVVDMAADFNSGGRSMFSRRLALSLEETLAASQKAVLLLNQRGFAKFLLCRECGYVPECPSCSTSLTYHEQGAKLICHHCGYQIAAPAACPECGSPYLKKFGAGTQRVEAELEALIARIGLEGVQVVRMDADTTKGKGSHQRLLEQFASAEAAVLLGTQMIAKGLDFDDVTLVGVINADTQLRLPDFRAAERTFDLIEQVAGRAGRADLPGRVIVQTYQADAVPIVAAAGYNRQLFLDDELPKREALRYPPYARLADVLCWGPDEAQVHDVAGALYNDIAALLDAEGLRSWTLLPPTQCVISKIKGSYRYHTTIKAPSNASIGGVLAPLFRTRKAVQGVNVAVDIDPASLL